MLNELVIRFLPRDPDGTLDYSRIFGILIKLGLTVSAAMWVINKIKSIIAGD